jgi:hypothetical protein
MADNLESKGIKDTFTAEFNLQGFKLKKEMRGTPAPEYGFSFPSMTAMHDRTKSNRSLSVYFRLLHFDGRLATYTFYDWRDMGKGL